MRYIIAGSIAFALVAGIALGFVFRGGAFEAEAKPPPERTRGRTVLVAQNVVLNPGGIHTTGFEDTADCQSMLILAETAPLAPALEVDLLPSADGVTSTGRLQTVTRPDGGGTAFHAFMAGFAGSNPAVAPMVAVRFRNTEVVGVTISKAWLYCAP